MEDNSRAKNSMSGVRGTTSNRLLPPLRIPKAMGKLKSPIGRSCESYRLGSTMKERTGATPFHLVYGGEAIVPVEVWVESDRIRVYDENNAERRHLELDLVDETRAKAAVWLMAYRQRMKQNYNRRVIPRSFQVGDLVWKKVKPVDDVTKLGAP
ncbi:uncharacterized protein LOC121986558 [Zingiber officinale]|uniref:uncharacterized protein LOC121986558 n=1 Tax=Zingiber officinale TaxID=94328 RepID=UPI001C4C9177|nr:uncharacterized protein LOC121986558 [Zingiber officinale]